MRPVLHRDQLPTQPPWLATIIIIWIASTSSYTDITTAIAIAVVLTLATAAVWTRYAIRRRREQHIEIFKQDTTREPAP